MELLQIFGSPCAFDVPEGHPKHGNPLCPQRCRQVPVVRAAPPAPLMTPQDIAAAPRALLMWGTHPVNLQGDCF